VSELRLSLRLLWKAPGYSTAVILTLALIVGANSAIFSAVHAVLLDPLPIRQPDRVIVGWEADAARNLPVIELSHRNFQDWAAHSRSLVQTAAVSSSTWSVVLELPGAPIRLSSAGVSASFFGRVRRRFAIEDGGNAAGSPHVPRSVDPCEPGSV